MVKLLLDSKACVAFEVCNSFDVFEVCNIFHRLRSVPCVILFLEVCNAFADFKVCNSRL
jgi:hypothetical protein